MSQGQTDTTNKNIKKLIKWFGDHLVQFILAILAGIIGVWLFLPRPILSVERSDYALAICGKSEIVRTIDVIVLDNGEPTSELYQLNTIFNFQEANQDICVCLTAENKINPHSCDYTESYNDLSDIWLTRDFSINRNGETIYVCKPDNCSYQTEK